MTQYSGLPTDSQSLFCCAGASSLRLKKFGWAFICSIVVLSVSAPRALAQTISPPSAAELNAITERGILLNEYDQAAWHASDVVQTANPKTTEGQKYIAKKENGRWTVAFGRLTADH